MQIKVESLIGREIPVCTCATGQDEPGQIGTAQKTPGETPLTTGIERLLTIFVQRED